MANNVVVTAPMPTIGQQFLDHLSICAFPAPGGDNENQWVVHAGDELARVLAALPNGRPANIDRKYSYPCVVTNAGQQKGVRVKIQPLIGTADDGIYLRTSDIEKLGLEDTGHTAPTRQGTCKVYSGVKFRFPDDYNSGRVVYTTEHVYELPPEIAKGVRVKQGANYKKHGIIGVPLLAKHLVFAHRGTTHVVDISLVSASAPLRAACVHMSPVSSLRLQRPQNAPAGDVKLSFEDFPGNALDTAMRKASRYAPPPFSVFDVKEVIPALVLAETCRACKRVEGSGGVKLSICTQCLKERRPERALYCSKECQAADWREKHKAEHAGQRPWERNKDVFGRFTNATSDQPAMHFGA